MPSDNSTVAVHSDVAFIGGADDAEDGPLTGGDLEWFSDLDGSLGTGAALTAQLDTVGDHVITLKATDSP